MILIRRCVFVIVAFLALALVLANVHLWNKSEGVGLLILNIAGLYNIAMPLFLFWDFGTGAYSDIAVHFRKNPRGHTVAFLIIILIESGLGWLMVIFL